MVSAISLGVFCRSAPSTSAIIRSRKPWPGSCVTRTRISSEITRVPAVTAERSPPASRITGALSPVIAASLTEATPAMTSPSAGINSPVATITSSPLRNCAAGRVCPVGKRANRSDLAARSEAAWARPRPSANASAKVPNSTVNHNQTISWSWKLSGSPLPPMSISTVSSAATTAVVNSTGLRISCAGVSLRKASPMAGSTRSAENIRVADVIIARP